MTVNELLDEGLLKDWAKAIEAIDIETVEALYSSTPQLLWTPLQLDDNDILEQLTQRLKELTILGSSLHPLYPLHYLILLFSDSIDHDKLQINAEQQPTLIKGLIDFILQNTDAEELNTSLWGSECNSIMHLAYYFLNQQQQQAAELIQHLIDRGALTTIANKSGHLPPDTIDDDTKTDATEPSESTVATKDANPEADDGPKLIINKSKNKNKAHATTATAGVSDKFKRLREMAEVKSSSHSPGSKMMIGRHNSAYRYFRPGHIEERKRRVLSEEEEAELEKEKLKRQREVELLVQRSAVKNNPLLKKLEVQQQQHGVQDNSSSTSNSENKAPTSKYLKTAVASVMDQQSQIRRGSKMIQALKDRSYVSDSVLRHQQMMAAEATQTENDEVNNSKLAKASSMTDKLHRLQPISPYDSENEELESDEEEGPTEDTIKAVIATDLYNNKTANRQESTDSLMKNGVVQHSQPDSASGSEDRCATPETKKFEQPKKRGMTETNGDNDDSIVNSLTVKSYRGDNTDIAAKFTASDKDRRVLTIKGSKVREIVQVHEHLNDKEEIEIYYTGKVFSVWKRNEYGEMTEEEQFTEAQFKKKSPELLEIAKEKLVSDETSSATGVLDNLSAGEDEHCQKHSSESEPSADNAAKTNNMSMSSSQRSSTSNNDEVLYNSRGSLNSDSTLSTISSYSTNDSIEQTRIIDEMGLLPLDTEDKNTTETNDAQIINDAIGDNYRNSLHLREFNKDLECQQRNSIYYDGERQIVNKRDSALNSIKTNPIETAQYRFDNSIYTPSKTNDQTTLIDGIRAEIEDFEFQDDDEQYDEDEGTVTPTNRNSQAILDRDQRHDTVQNLVNLVKQRLNQDEKRDELNISDKIVNNELFNKARRQSGTQRRLWALSYIDHQDQQHKYEQSVADETATTHEIKEMRSHSNSSSSYSEEQWYDPDSREENSSGSWQTDSQRESFMTSQQYYSSNNSVNDDDNDTASIASSVYSKEGTIIRDLNEEDSIHTHHGEFLLHRPGKLANSTTRPVLADQTNNVDADTTTAEPTRSIQTHLTADSSLPTVRAIIGDEQYNDTVEYSSVDPENAVIRAVDEDKKTLKDIQKSPKPIESARDTMKITRTDILNDNGTRNDKSTSVFSNTSNGEGEIVIFMNESYGRTTRLDDLVATEKHKNATPAFNPPLSRMSGKVELKPGQLSLQSEKDYHRSLIPMAEVDFPIPARQGDNLHTSNIPSKNDNQPRIEDISYYMSALPSLKQSTTPSDDTIANSKHFSFLEHDDAMLKNPVDYNQQQHQIGKGRVIYAQHEQPIKDSVTANTERWTPLPCQPQDNTSSLLTPAQLQSKVTNTVSEDKLVSSATTSFEMNRYGKMYIGVSGAHHMLLPLPKEITYVRCVISDGEYEYMSRYEILTHQILMDYECIIDTKPGQIITVSLHVRPDYHVKPKTGLVSRWFTSARKQKEHLSGYVHPEDGAIGQTRFAVNHMVPVCYKKTYEAQFDCFNSWYARTNRERARREQFGDEEDFLKIVGKLNIEMLYLPVSDPSLPVPRSLRECDLMLKIRQWHDTCWKSGYLTTRLQGSNIWERHFYKLVGSQLIGYTSDTDKQQIWKHYNIADVVRLSASTDKVIVTLVKEDENMDKVFTKESIHSENQKGFFRLSFSDYYVDCVSDNLEDSEDWVTTLKAMIGRVPLRLPFSTN